MDPNAFDADRFVTQLRREFIDNTRDRLTIVDDLITRLMDGGSGFDDALMKLQRHVHSIKGMGGTFDFPTVTTIAHRLEDYMETASELTVSHFESSGCSTPGSH